MVFPSFFPFRLILRFAGPEGAKNPRGEMSSTRFRPRLGTPSLAKIAAACQGSSPQLQTADSRFTNAATNVTQAAAEMPSMRACDLCAAHFIFRRRVFGTI